MDDDVDEQIEQLLIEAEERLRSASTVQRSGSHDLVAADPLTEEFREMLQSDTTQFRFPLLKTRQLPQPYVRSMGDTAHVDTKRMVDVQERRSANGLRKVEDPYMVKQRLQKQKSATTGPRWFDMPRTTVTPELKRDLQVLQMRSVLDPKRHYKKDQVRKKLGDPQYLQIGTVIEGPTEFFSGRIPNRERRKTFVHEVLADTETRDRFKRKYNELQLAKKSGKKAYYKKLRAKRVKRRK